MSDVTRIPTQPSALASYLETTDDYQTAAILPAPPNYTRWNWTSQESTDWHDFRVNYGTLHYQITIDDPGAYTAPWTSGIPFRWTPGESFEFVCQENNFAPELIMGEDLTPVVSPRFVP